MSAPLILAANTVASGDDLRVENALNFMGVSDNARFQRTNSSSGSSTKATLSAWVKYQTDVDQSVPIFMAPDAAGNDRFYINITGSEELGGTHRYPDCDFSSTDDVKLRDPAAWYHIVAVINTNDGTAADRLKIYLNNQRITLTFATGGGLGSGSNIHFNTSGYKNVFGYNDTTNDGAQNLTDMYFSEVIKCDGQVLAPTDFAEYDENGIWVPKTGLDTSLTFGTTGYYYNFADSSDLGNDVSGNNNDASDVSNTTQSLDTPSNNFATWNPAIPPTAANHNFKEGNLLIEGETSSQNTTFSTFAVSSGKWFCEMKLTVEGNATSSVPNFGIASTADFKHADSEAYYESSGTNIYAGRVNSAQINHNGSDSGTDLSDTPDVGDMMGLALDLDSGTKTLKFYLNGALVGTVNINADEYCFITAVKEDSNKATVEANFGNPQFSISSGNSDENGFGNFEYAVPSGYFSLCTKNIAEYG